MITYNMSFHLKIELQGYTDQVLEIKYLNVLLVHKMLENTIQIVCFNILNFWTTRAPYEKY